MGYTYIQTTKLFAGSGGSVSGNVTSTAGNLLVGTGAVGGAATSFTGSGGGTWSTDVGPDSGLSASVGSAAIMSTPNATGGTQSLTFSTNAGAGHAVLVFVNEFSGNPTSSPLDGSPPASNDNAATTTPQTNTYTNISPNALFIAWCANADGANPGSITGGSTGNWTSPAAAQDLNGSAEWVAQMSYDIVSSVVINNKQTWTTNSFAAYGQLVCYKALPLLVRELTASNMVISTGTPNLLAG